MHRETGLKWVAGGAAVEAIGALATIALAIVGLAGVYPTALASIATLIISAAILSESGSFGAASLTARTPGESSSLEMGGGLSAQFLGGVTGIVLGILALLGVVPQTLLSVAVIIFGASFLFGGTGGVAAHWSAGYLRGRPSTGGGEVMVGLAAIVLGILAVIGMDTVTLVLVALLSLGVAALFSGSAWSARSTAELQR